MARTTLQKTLKDSGSTVLDAWVVSQMSSGTMRADLIDEARLREQSQGFLSVFSRAAVELGLEEVEGAEWEEVRSFLQGLSRERAEQGFSPSETASFIFSLKEPLFEAMRAGSKGEVSLDEVWELTRALDRLALFTAEQYQAGREGVIRRQQQEILELSTPVVQIWQGVVAVPLIGTLDSERTQVVMESLLQAIVAREASVAIIDITGVPAVDTLVAQHLIKTVSAARLMGAECIISGIRPQIAQTMVHLGIQLEDVATKASLADAIQLSFRKLGLQITRRES